jgi:5-oxoprolinase (ATP-hydrolysing)
MESRYPVKLKRFEIRENSGGNGKWKGGNGIIREIEFLTPLKLSILSQHRVYAPYGINGGNEGAKGEQYLQKIGNENIKLEGNCAIDVAPGDILTMMTPGGGGFGTPT